MPRKNNNDRSKFIRYEPKMSNAKKRYPNKREAEEAANYQMALDLGLELFVYQDIDGGWSLTKRKMS